MKVTRVLTLGVASAALVGGALAGAPEASAGGYGQQLAVATHYSDEIIVCGYNTSDRYDCMGGWTPSPNYWTYFPDHWLHGTVEITGYQYSTRTYRYAACLPPTSQASNWFYCDTYNKL